MISPVQDKGQVGPALSALKAAEAHAAGGGRFGASLVSFASIGSTNDVARDLAGQGAPEGCVVVADQQLRGRGRMGREWVSPPGGGLWLSLVLRPRLPLARLGPLALVAAVGARSAVEQLTGVPCRLKWPNDLILGGRKVGGILTEASGGSADAPPSFVILGIGINVNLLPQEMPDWLRARATSLAWATGRTWPVAEVGAAVLARLEHCYRRFIERGFDEIRDEWITGSETIGRLVTAATASGEITGRALGIDSYGRLVLLLADGGTEHVTAGDVTLANTINGGGGHTAGP